MLILETLESLDTTLNYINERVNKMTESLYEIDLEEDEIKPLVFKGLKTVEAARITLRTFFEALLDMNVYKTDLEDKCAELSEV